MSAIDPHAEGAFERLAGTRDGHVAADLDDGPVTGRRAMRPLERLALLCDEGSLQRIRSGVSSEPVGREGDGVVVAGGRIGGRPVYCFAQDATVSGGSVGRAHADAVVRVQRLAREAGVPLVGFVASGGARMQEGLDALDGYARVFSEHVAASGWIPQISVITGTSAGGGCYSPALTDFVVMTGAASMFLTGPAVVEEVTGERIAAQELGGPGVHDRNGVCQLAVEGDVDAIFRVRELLGFLPQNAGEAPPRAVPADPDGPEPGACVPLDPRRTYDVRDPVAGIVDGGSLLELSPRWAPNLVCALARVDGRPVGVVANQPRHLGGVLDADASQKGARFVRTCTAFGIPLVVLVDTPGFLPGSRQEGAGVIRHGAELLRAFAAADVPRVTVVLRKAFGGAYITMNSKDLGATLSVAWPQAELGIMGAAQAVGVAHRRELAAAADPAATRARLAAAYAERHLGARAAARGGHVDEVVAPARTREVLAWTLATQRPRARRRCG